MQQALSQDALAILLLCADLGRNDSEKSLTDLEFSSLGATLWKQQLRPANLLSSLEGLPQQIPVAAKNNASRTIPLDRIASLLKRGAQLGFMLDTWDSQGIAVICRSDELYPERFRKHLAPLFPPILFCSGNLSLLKSDGISFVGSRNASDSALAFTKMAASKVAEKGLSVVSGGARGVDSTAMLAALQAAGDVVGILSSNLVSEIVRSDYRSALAKNSLLLLSPFSPESHFSAGNAMSRNKLIYAFSDKTVVVASTKEKGGTWAGAVEELRRKNARPVYVWSQAPLSEGNAALLKLGARKLLTVEDLFATPEPSPSKPTTMREGSLLESTSAPCPINQQESPQQRGDSAKHCMEKSIASLEVQRPEEAIGTMPIENEKQEKTQKETVPAQAASEKHSPACTTVSIQIEKLAKLLQRRNQEANLDLNESLEILDLSNEARDSLLKLLNTAPQEEDSSKELQPEFCMGR